MNYCEFDLEGGLVAVPHAWYLLPGLSLHYLTCLKRAGHGGYECMEKEMCRFAQDIVSKGTEECF